MGAQLKKILKSQARKIKKRIQRELVLKDEFTPRQISASDVFIVSYPRSGNTWVRFLIGNLVKPEGKSLNFRNINKVVPSVLALPNRNQYQHSPRIIKSHSPYHADYPRTVYILRDGRDAYASQFRFLQDKLPPDLTFAQFILRQKKWPCDWDEHINSWSNQQLSAETFLLIRYEDIKDNPEQALQTICDFSGIHKTADQIATAVDASSVEKMRQVEASHGGPRSLKTGKFVNQTDSAEWRQLLTASEQIEVKAKLEPTLNKFGYLW